MRGRDLHHVGAVLGQRAGAGRPGKHAREVEHADAVQRAIAGRQRLGRTVADADDLHQRQRRDGGRLRMACPFGVAAHHAAGALGGDDRLLEIGGVPARHGARHRLALLCHAEHAERGGTMVGEIAMQIAPPSVAGRIDAHDAVARVRKRTVAELHVGPAAQRRRRLPQVDRHRLAPPGPVFPQGGGREPRRRPGSRRRPCRCGTASAAPGRCRR